MLTGVIESNGGSMSQREEIDTPRVIESSRDEIVSSQYIGRQYLQCQPSVNVSSDEFSSSVKNPISSAGNINLSHTKSLRNKAANMNQIKNFNDVVRLSNNSRSRLKALCQIEF